MDAESRINVCSDQNIEVSKKFLTMINIVGDKMCPYATTSFKSLSNFLLISVHLKITTRDRKFWGNRVEPCHCLNIKLISGYLITEVSFFHVSHQPSWMNASVCNGRCEYANICIQGGFKFTSTVRAKVKHIKFQ